MIRAFVAIELPSEAKEALARKQDELRSRLGRAAGAVRWSRPDGVHLTLQFLGDVPRERLAALFEAIRAGSRGAVPLRLSLSRTGAFPGIVRPRVVWIGLEGDTGRVRLLQEAISSRLSALGYRPDKPFQPHVTLGRVRDTARRDELAVIFEVLKDEENTPIREVPFIARRVSLMRSDLQPGGSIYTELAGAELA